MYLAGVTSIKAMHLGSLGLGQIFPRAASGLVDRQCVSVRRGLSAGNPVFMSKVRLLKGFGRMFSRSDKAEAYIDQFHPFHAHH